MWKVLNRMDYPLPPFALLLLPLPLQKGIIAPKTFSFRGKVPFQFINYPIELVNWPWNCSLISLFRLRQNFLWLQHYYGYDGSCSYRVIHIAPLTSLEKEDENLFFVSEKSITSFVGLGRFSHERIMTCDLPKQMTTCGITWKNH